MGFHRTDRRGREDELGSSALESSPASSESDESSSSQTVGAALLGVLPGSCAVSASGGAHKTSVDVTVLCAACWAVDLAGARRDVLGSGPLTLAGGVESMFADTLFGSHISETTDEIGLIGLRGLKDCFFS